MLLDDNDHTQAKSARRRTGRPGFRDGRWLSRPETVQLPVRRAKRGDKTHATTQVLSLRPQPQGELAGEMTVTVQTNECGQRGAVVRIPAVAHPQRRRATGVTVPDPATVPDPPRGADHRRRRVPIADPRRLTSVLRLTRRFTEKIASTCYLC